MNKRTEILQELKETAPLLTSVPNKNVFSTPVGYFDNLSNSILLKVKSITLHEHNDTEILEELAPVLNSIKKKNVYTVPDDYFKNFSVNTNAQKTSGKIISLKKVIRYVAVAAVFAGIVFTAGGLLFNHYKTNQVSSEPLNISNAIKGISDEELSLYADEHNIQLNYDNLTDDDNEVNVTAELKDISSNELMQYYKNEHLKNSASSDN